MSKPTASQLKATMQLAGMNFQADPANEHKRQVWEKAQADFEQAEQAELAERQESEQATQKSGQEPDPKDEKIKELEQDVFLKNQQIEKLTSKVAVLESAQKSLLSGKPASGSALKPATKPTTAKGAAKPATTPGAAKAAAKPATTVTTPAPATTEAAPAATPATAPDPAPATAPETATTATDGQGGEEPKKNS